MRDSRPFVYGAAIAFNEIKIDVVDVAAGSKTPGAASGVDVDF